VQSAKGQSNFVSAASIPPLCKAVRVQFSDPYKNVGKTSVLYIFKIVSVLTSSLNRFAQELFFLNFSTPCI